MEKRWVPVAVVLTLVIASAVTRAEFGIQSIIITNNNVRIAWFAPPGSNYVVQVANGNAGGYTNNFTDIGPTNFIPGIAEVLTNYTHVNGALNTTSRFYRVRSFPAAPVLQSIELWPTNSIIPVDMVNRFRAIGRYSDGSQSDLSDLVTLTSLTPSLTTIRPKSNGFLRVYGVASGMATVRVAYASVTNAIPERVAQMTSTTIDPSALELTVGQSSEVRFYGDFLGEEIFRKSLASSEFDSPQSGTTVIFYGNSVQQDVANGYAVVTGVSYQSDTIAFSGGGSSANFSFTWCTYDSIQISPTVAEISVGQTQQFTVVGYNGYGARNPATDGVPTDFNANDPSVLQHLGAGQFVALKPGSVLIKVTAFNFGNCNNLHDSATITVRDNDNFADRFTVSGSSVSTGGSNVTATKEPGEPNHAAGNVGGKSVWWSWTAPVTGTVTISTCGSNFDTLLGVYTGTTVNALTPIANNDDNSVCGGDGLQSRVQFTATAGTVYQIAVDGYKYAAETEARSGNIVLTISQ